MSSVTDAVLLLDGRAQPGQLEEFNRRLKAFDPGWSFEQLDTEGAGGSKVFCSDVLAGALNYARLDEVCAAIQGVDWLKERECFSLPVLMVNDEARESGWVRVDIARGEVAR